MKQEGDGHLKGQIKVGFTAPLYVPIPQLKNGGLISIKEFVKKYELCSESLNPKCVKVPRDISKKFNPIVNKNSYNYEFTKDHVFIEKIEKL
jgi:hypothetical protein